MLVALLLQAIDPAAVIAAGQARTAVATHCTYDGDSADITVCGRRQADRFRVPFANATIARRDDVRAERGELLQWKAPVDQLSPFLVGGGEMGQHSGVGVGVTVGANTTKVAGLRELAP